MAFLKWILFLGLTTSAITILLHTILISDDDNSIFSSPPLTGISFGLSHEIESIGRSQLISQDDARFAIQWLTNDGVSTPDFPTKEELRRQVALHLLRYRKLSKYEMKHTSLSDLIRIIVREDLVEESHQNQRFTRLLDSSTPLFASKREWIKENTGAIEITKTESISDQNNKNDIAWTIPFHQNELAKVKVWFDSFSVNTPCSIGWAQREEKQTRVHFVWAFGGNFGSADGQVVLASLKDMWASSERVSQCFSSVSYLSLNTSNSFRRLDGACVTLHLLVHLLKSDFDAFQLVETDIRPIRSGWLEELVHFSDMPNVCEGWWVKGSLSKCRASYARMDQRQDYHINGNALYALNCPDFESFLRRIQLFYPARPDIKDREAKIAGGCETGGEFEGGYDHVMFQYRKQPENFEYAREIFTKFQYTSYLANLCEEMYRPTSILKSNPNTYLVHSKSVFLSPMITEALVSIHQDPYKLLYRLPSILPRLYSGELNMSSALTQWTSKASLHGPVETHGWATAYPDKFYIWTTDLHGGPIACQMPIFREAGAVVHAEIDFGNCMYQGYCKDRLKVLSFDNWKGFSLESGDMKADALIEKFYDTYEHDPEFDRIDAFICSHPAANCQLFMKFKKPIIVYATTRIEFGRHDSGVFWRKGIWNEEKGKAMWRQWVDDMRMLSRDPRNVIAANNRYDAAYIRYFTGVDALYIPSWCGDLNYEYELLRNNKKLFQPYPVYTPIKDAFLIGPYRTNLDLLRNGSKTELEMHPIVQELRSAQKMHGVKVSFFDEEFPKGYQYEDLVRYKGIMILPYQVSTISFFEFYRLNIPLFCPSKSLLIKWHTEHSDFLWERIYGWPDQLYPLDSRDELSRAPNPNTNSDASFSFWLDFADWFTFPHIQLFDSFDHLMELLASANLFEISRQMKSHNIDQRQELVDTWKQIFEKMRA